MEDILVRLTNSEIYNLFTFYEKQPENNYYPHVLRFLYNARKWSENLSSKDFIKVFVPNGEFLPDGTFIALSEFNCYDLFMFTLDKTCFRLQEALKQTKIFDWKREVLIYALHEDLYKSVLDTIKKDCNISINFIQESALWILDHNKKQHIINCPKDYTIDELNTTHANIINQLWPYRYEGSENYIKTLIEVNGGKGIFHKKVGDSEQELVAWALKNNIGEIGMLQTKVEYQRKGLGTLILKAIANKLSADGIPPMAIIGMGNFASHQIFKKCDFKLLAKCYYIGAGKPSSVAFDCNYDFTLKDINKL